MRKLIMWNLVTLDGYFEGAKPWDLPWHEVAWGDELEKLSIEQLESADMLVFGRVTYEGMAAYWQTATGIVADYMNSLPKVVCSHTLQSATWNNSILVRDDAAAAVERMKHEGDGDMYVFGSADLSRTLMDAHLFDEYRLGVAPVIHGEGKLMFPPGVARQGLGLLGADTLSNGCVILRYRPEGVGQGG